MRPSTLWGTLSLALCCYIFEATCSLEANASSSLSVSRIDSGNRHGAAKNYAEFRTGQPHAVSLIPTLKHSKRGNFSQQKIHFSKIRSTNQNEETYDGFEFVDSPEIATDAPDSTEKTNGGIQRFKSAATGLERSIGGAPDVSNNGAIEDNSWKRYPNGTIIHDVRISLIHPANMVGIMNEGNLGSSAPVGSDDSFIGRKIRTNLTRDGRASLRHSTNYDANNATMIPFELVSMGDGSSVIARNRTEIDLVNNYTILPPTSGTNTSTIRVEFVTNESARVTASSFAAHRMTLDGKLPPVINLGISINAKGPCFSECLTKCSTVESKNSGMNQATCLPSCLPRLVDSMKGGLEIGRSSSTDDTNTSTDSVPILPLDQRADVLDNITSSDLEVASGIEIGMLKNKESTEPKLGFLLEDICLSESCVLKAASIIRKLQKSADPCDSFYKFACGGYFKNGIPDGESSRSVFSDISSDILARMYSVLNSPLRANDHPPVKLLKKFYGKCILTSPKELVMDALKELGGWPSPYSPSQRVPQHSWGAIAFNWTYGMFLEYNLISINLTFASDGDKWMLNVDYPWFVKMALNSDSVSVLDEMERDIRTVASALGIDNSTTRSVLVDLRIFMASAIKYAKATLPRAEKGVYSLKDLKAKFIHLDVLKKLPSLLKTAIVIEDNEVVYVSNMMYLRKVDDLLRDSTVRTQAGHLVLTALRTLLVLIGTATDNVREKYCVKLTGKLFPHLFGHLYSSSFVSNSKVASATKISSHIRDSLLRLLDEKVNLTIKDKVNDRVSKLMFIWSHRNALNDDLNGIARGFDENPSFLGFVKTGIWNLKKGMYTYLHQSVNSTLASFIERYSVDDYGVNAFYYSEHVLIPYSALHENIFDPDVPHYVSFGGLGLIVGHELLHSVIAAGDISKSVNYRNMEKCMINQFNEFAKKHSDDRVNGILTKDENIADYGGFKVAYRAFMEWYNHSSKEPKEKRLPGLHKFNEKQMFWLTAATNWCQKIPPDFVSPSVDKHAPPEYRVDGQFANMPEFAQDFNCPEDSPMNPKEKCSLW